jgi:hypothetical protein
VKLSGDFYGRSADVAAQHVTVAGAEQERVAGFEFGFLRNAEARSFSPTPEMPEIAEAEALVPRFT